METTAATEAILETLETVAETVAETLPPETLSHIVEETIPQVIEIVETVNYTTILTDILGSVQNMEYFLTLITGFSLFAVIVCLCYFCYKFLRIFF